MELSATWQIEPRMITAFAAVTGATARIHLDPEYAATTSFGGVVAQGMLLTALIERWLATIPHDGTELRVLETTFLAPVRPGDRFAVRLIPETGDCEPGRAYRLEGFVGQTTVVTGRARLAR